MNYLRVALFIGVIAVCNCRKSDEEFEKITKDCAKEVDADEGIWKKVEKANLDEPKTPEFMFCLYKKVNFLTDSAEYEKDTIKTVMTELFGEDLATKMVEDCTKETYDNGVETSIKMSKCFFKYIPIDETKESR